MIRRFEVKNYKALRDCALELTPIHVLIGPNDSGKTSILEAIAALCRSANHPLPNAFAGRWEGNQLVWHNDPSLSVDLIAWIQINGHELEYRLSSYFGPQGRTATIADEIVKISDGQTIKFNQTGNPHSAVALFNLGQRPNESWRTTAAEISSALSGVDYFRWNTQLLSLPVAPDSSRRFRMKSSGFGLALCLDDILGFDRDQFIALENRFRAIFPHILSIKLVPESAFRSPNEDAQQIAMLQNADGKGIYFQFKGGTQLVPASQVSDGVLLVLAYLTVLYLPKPPRLLLVEEPENGIHPNRLKDVLTILRDLVKEQSYTQVILTTHSPYVLDLFKPEEVSLCTKGADGSVSVRRLSESQTVRDQIDIFTLGEIWSAEGDESLAKTDAAKVEPPK